MRRGSRRSPLPGFSCWPSEASLFSGGASWSLAVLGVALAMTVAWTALGYPGNPIFLILVSLYAVGRYFPERRISLAALAVALAVVGFGQVTDGDLASEVVAALVVTRCRGTSVVGSESVATTRLSLGSVPSIWNGSGPPRPSEPSPMPAPGLHVNSTTLLRTT